MSELPAGLSCEIEHEVTATDSAARWGSGALPVLSTPALVGLMEHAALRSLEGHLPSGMTTVGGHIDIHHLAASRLGALVRVRAKLVGVAGKKLTFKIQAWEAAELIGEAEHDRFIVDEARFMAKVQAKK